MSIIFVHLLGTYETLHVSFSFMEIRLSILKDHVFRRGVEDRYGLFYDLILEFKYFVFIQWIEKDPLNIQAINSLEFMHMTSRRLNPLGG